MVARGSRLSTGLLQRANIKLFIASMYCMTTRGDFVCDTADIASGHGGSGYQASWGSAAAVRELVEQDLAGDKE